ncbi:MAG TPA: SGNH/GDSL hydrolase family protein [Candidatus Limnocylindria bacterium]|jgi:hypothetical protein|nr:SGNH/GDSL hydrolase family protein [Candidatus Limnocylindria bacterium]
MDVLTLFTFGDSVLDSGRYNERGLNAGALLARNDDRLFPEFAGRDLSRRWKVTLEHRALDGHEVTDLMTQLPASPPPAAAVALLSVGGNDILRYLLQPNPDGVRSFERELRRFLAALDVRPVLIANIYDPSFGDDRNNFLGDEVDPKVVRENHARVNAVLERAGEASGATVDLHSHFLTGDPSWFAQTIEPSLVGASEIRRCFLGSLEGLGIA